MEITFTKNLKKIVKNPEKKLGVNCGKILKRRLEQLTVAQTLEDTRFIAGRYHELAGNRKGQWACDLEHPDRLIFEPHENPIPTNEHGIYEWGKIKGVEVVEIGDYH